MKRLAGVLVALFLTVASWTMMPISGAQAMDLTRVTALSPSLLAVAERRNAADDKLSELGRKIDLNNSDVRDFRQYRGFYPGLASKIVQNAPYESVEDVLNIPGLSATQKERLQANIDSFIVTPPASVFNEGDDRYNPGVY